MKRFLISALSALAAFAQTPGDVNLRWFHDARYGMFIHWGLYSVLAGQWRGRPVPGSANWIMHDARIPVREYEQLASQFNPTQFDADAWVKLAEDAGAKYIIVTAKDHDGFAMYRSRVSPYNVFDATPFHRDPLRELSAACSRRHMKLGIYYSQALDWDDPDAAGNDWDFAPGAKPDFDRYLRAKAEPQLRELLTDYGPLAVVWFDTPLLMNPERARRFLQLVRSLQPSALINGRLGVPGDYLSMDDNRIPDGAVQGAWEVPATINSSWGFNRFDNRWKSPDELIFNLVDVVSKGGNYLLEAGPTAEGYIPRPGSGEFENVGAWLRMNGDAIYGAGPTVVGAEDSPKWRCTTKPGKLFITLFQWPDAPLEIQHIHGKVGNAHLLAGEPQSLKFIQDGDRVLVTLPKDPPLLDEIPERLNPALYLASLRAHVQRVLLLEMQ